MINSDVKIISSTYPNPFEGRFRDKNHKYRLLKLSKEMYIIYFLNSSYFDMY